MEKPTAPTAPKSPTTALDIEVRHFAESLPDWSRYICAKILSGHHLQDEDISTAFHYLLEDSSLKVKPVRPDIKISASNETTNSYKTDLLLSKLENVEGVLLLKVV
jgi:hypothetical protein